MAGVFFKEFAIVAMMAVIKTELDALGIGHNVFSSLKDLVSDGAVDRALFWIFQKEKSPKIGNLASS